MLDSLDTPHLLWLLGATALRDTIKDHSGSQVLPHRLKEFLMRTFRFLLAACLALAFLGIPARPQGNGKGKAKGHDKQQAGIDEDQGRAREQYGFRAQDRELVSAYYAKHGSGLPPGLAKRNGSLPPGLEKQLERNGTLPPGLQKKLQPCPVEITRALPPLPPAYQRSVIGAHIVVFNKTTHIIVDVMKDVVR
jgi:hypothetical protein